MATEATKRDAHRLTEIGVCEPLPPPAPLCEGVPGSPGAEADRGPASLRCRATHRIRWQPASCATRQLGWALRSALVDESDRVEQGQIGVLRAILAALQTKHNSQLTTR